MLRFDPFSDLDALTRGLLTSQTGSTRTPRFMPMDLCKIDDHYVLTADLPGIDPGSVDVDVDSGTLTISTNNPARMAAPPRISRSMTSHAVSTGAGAPIT